MARAKVLMGLWAKASSARRTEVGILSSGLLGDMKAHFLVIPRVRKSRALQNELKTGCEKNTVIGECSIAFYQPLWPSQQAAGYGLVPTDPSHFEGLVFVRGVR